MNIQYSDARYTFTNPTPERKYIKTLDAIRKFNMKGVSPTRKDICLTMGEPDPTEITGMGWGDKPIRKNWGTSRFNALHQAGLIALSREGKTVRYTLTANGAMLLHSVL